jgi:hypothetical protein
MFLIQLLTQLLLNEAACLAVSTLYPVICKTTNKNPFKAKWVERPGNWFAEEDGAYFFLRKKGCNFELNIVLQHQVMNDFATSWTALITETGLVYLTGGTWCP